ncbi:uncharacterized protein LOC134788112 [Penaeus indicus]|uniref:uncharacterized protein LOC134788112 n=1 Tax=Penaeus indicus TaxID=29960 RepID=UPI00300C048E
MSWNTTKVTHVMREVPHEELAGLKDRMSRYLPHSASIYGIVGTKLRHPLVQEISTDVYVPESHPDSSLVVATPSCSSDLLKSLTVFWCLEEEEDDEDVALLLASLPACLWKQPLFFYACSVPVLRKLESLLNYECLAGGQTVWHRMSEGMMYSLSREDLQVHQLPPGFTMGPLRPEDTPTVRSWWKYSWSESYAVLLAHINHLPSVGVYKDGEDGGASEGDRKLVSWIQQYKNGNMGNTFTLPEYRRLGLARCATLALSRKNIESGRPAYLVIDETNTDSILFHEKIGFKKQCGVGWNASLPPGVALEDVIRERND